MNICDTILIVKHKRIPNKVGNINANRVHFILPVSLKILKQVVEQGQCNKVNMIVHNAVVQVHPLVTSKL